MTDNERELLEIIRNHNNTEKAFETAIRIILEFLEQDESSQEQQVAYSQVSA